jgi:hypothetical protein
MTHMEVTRMSSTAMFTRAECRAWLNGLGLDATKLPSAGKVLYVDQPNVGVWRVMALAGGGFAVQPWSANP